MDIKSALILWISYKDKRFGSLRLLDKQKNQLYKELFI